MVMEAKRTLCLHGGKEMKRIEKQDMIFSILILLWIFLVNIVTPLVTTAPAWPMFFVTIFFFTMEGNVKKIPSIFLSGAVGIGMTYLIVKGMYILKPLIGIQITTACLIFGALALIIVGGNYLPIVFNNTTFAYLTIAAIDLTIVEDNVLDWMTMLILGGGIILAGALVISKGLQAIFSSLRGGEEKSLS